MMFNGLLNYLLSFNSANNAVSKKNKQPVLVINNFYITKDLKGDGEDE